MSRYLIPIHAMMSIATSTSGGADFLSFHKEAKESGGEEALDEHRRICTRKEDLLDRVKGEEGQDDDRTTTSTPSCKIRRSHLLASETTFRITRVSLRRILVFTLSLIDAEE